MWLPSDTKPAVEGSSWRDKAMQQMVDFGLGDVLDISDFNGFFYILFTKRGD